MLILESVLKEREIISSTRQNFISDKAVLCFSLNIPYEFKLSCKDEILDLFRFGIEEIVNKFNISKQAVYYENYFALFSIDLDPIELKKSCMQLEQKYSFSRLFDMDVYMNNQVIKLRKQARKCFICPNLSLVCRREAKHSKDELNAKINEFLDDFYVQLAYLHPLKNDFAVFALEALLEELCLAPKLGLVEVNNSNSHKDMNHHTFIKSSSALIWYFNSFYTLAKISKNNDFVRLKKLGQLAENEMFSATNGINSHKGALFLFAILIFCCSRTENDLSLNNISQMSQNLCANLCANELNENLTSISAQAYNKFGFKGVRYEVESGFKSTLKAYEFYKCQKDFKELKTLFFISSICDDTSLLKRADFNLSTFLHIKQTCARLSTLENKKFLQIIKRLNYFYTNANISFGGSADILALVIFLSKINLKT